MVSPTHFFLFWFHCISRLALFVINCRVTADRALIELYNIPRAVHTLSFAIH